MSTFTQANYQEFVESDAFTSEILELIDDQILDDPVNNIDQFKYFIRELCDEETLMNSGLDINNDDHLNQLAKYLDQVGY